MRTTKLAEEFIRTFNIHQIIEEKPKSGQKQVYIVEIDGSIFALKIIPTADERIVRELNIYERFKDNRGIPNVIRAQKYGDELVVIEEFIDGNDLSLISSQYINNSEKIRQLIADIAYILTPVWNNRCVHRDLKPQNIIIRNDGHPVVLDFGIARDLDDETITPTGFQPFTWSFGSPEQYFFKKEQISYRTDFFCLGIIAYYLYTHTLPFGKSRYAIAESFTQPQKIYDVHNEEMNIFLNIVLKYSVAERPRTVEQFIKSLNI
nr:protein kinase [uncultured Bacteroides sp.]